MGKQIRIYLADGTSTGIRHAEITNWSGQALACPRSRFSELKDWEEIKRPGVYFLFGIDDETGDEAVYIGESEVVLDRLSSHLTGKDFWSELIAFTSKDDHLTKGHVKYLESKLIQLSTSANRYLVTNTAAPQLPSLPRADRDAMEEYLESVKSLLGVLGHRVLDPYASPIRAPLPTDTLKTSPQNNTEFSVSSDALYGTTQPLTFSLQTSGLTARATRTDEGLVVLTGSEAATETRNSLSNGYRSLRESLIASGVFQRVDGKYETTKDYLFKSPSQAAAVLVGYSINGRDHWRLPDGTSYGACEQEISNSLLNQLNDKK
ncbi:MAG TPA: GIY-YIG nuclease family protein [Rhodocyclaceae bacterium]|jgi:hypothetical protein